MGKMSCKLAVTVILMWLLRRGRGCVVDDASMTWWRIKLPEDSLFTAAFVPNVGTYDVFLICIMVGMVGTVPYLELRHDDEK
jgi:hypothetical protein